MITINKAKHLSLLILLGAWGCTSNQYVSRSGGGYDDLYGGGPGSGVVTRDGGADQELSRGDNPDYSYTGDGESGTADYYDESYMTSRGVKRAVSSDVGYNAGFVDGFNSATSNISPFYGGIGSYWPGSMMNAGFRIGYGNGFRMSPYIGFGMGSMMGGYSPWGYSPFGYGSMMGYGGMMGYGNMMGYSPFGYDPFGYNMYGYGYDGFYGGGYGGGYGYSPWAYSRPVVVVNNVERGVSRTYGPRVVSNGRVRSAANSTPSRSGAVTTNRSNGRRSSNAISANETYSSPRSGRTSTRGEVNNTGGRMANESYSTRGASEGNNVYYSRPRQAGGSTYSQPNSGSAGNYTSPRSSRSGNTYSQPSYNVPSRSQSDYSAPTRTYQQPSRSESYNAPSRTYSAPSAPTRSYSAPSGGGGGGGATRSSSRGPR
ncbi:hypothetical protein DYBT9623_01418 [Dyadobacter sp. CECT 9623]|uniref:Prolyl-tRNA synthetase n=1 Tax=Dyadobacter linearis TaxID=2823330 RepID=A0ABM8UMG4_9BACT|nr:hypothetical protein [Dyadobacter sp. CECT 9623]CAG5068686.1 hypothetical protein DYBT9623_01418 [Dyadobacter sp. CECT 9623]